MPHAFTTRAALAAALLFAAATPTARADGATVYKCSSGGRSVYQDHPCDAAREDGARGDGTLDALFARARASEQELTAMQQAHQGQMQALQKKRRRAVDPAAVDAEIATVERNWQQRMAEARARHQVTQASIRSRCPRGASVAEGRTTCLR